MYDFSGSGFFFDFDGVLVDSVGIKTMAFRQLFEHFGEDVLAKVLEHHRLNGGISRIDKIQYSHTHFVGTPLSAAELQEWGRRYSQRVVDQVVEAPWIAGAQEFLDRIRGCCPIFVISGTPEDELKEIIAARRMAGYFTEILGSPVRKPAHIRNLLRDYRLKPKSCVFIGDALTDYGAAKETGLHFIGIQGDVELPADALMLPDCTNLLEAVEELFSQ